MTRRMMKRTSGSSGCEWAGGERRSIGAVVGRLLMRVTVEHAGVLVFVLVPDTFVGVSMAVNQIGRP